MLFARVRLQHAVAVARRTLYTTATEGQFGTVEFRMYMRKKDATVSPWHDIPLFVDRERGIVNFVAEIPRGERQKMEIATDEQLNPIKQDVKKGKPRLYAFDSLVNYGALPQTWEDPEHRGMGLDFPGDNDPVDVLELSDRKTRVGEVYPVKVLGVLGMIDGGEMDWKIIAVDAQHEALNRLDSVVDVERQFPGRIAAAREWFRTYKVPEGKPPSEFAFDGQAQDRDFALKVIADAHESWTRLVARQAKGAEDVWVGGGRAEE